MAVPFPKLPMYQVWPHDDSAQYGATIYIERGRGQHVYMAEVYERRHASLLAASPALAEAARVALGYLSRYNEQHPEDEPALNALLHLSWALALSKQVYLFSEEHSERERHGCVICRHQCQPPAGNKTACVPLDEGKDTDII